MPASPQANTAEAAPRTTLSELGRLRDAGEITPAAYDRDRAIYEDAREAMHAMKSSRRRGLRAPLVHLDRIARAGMLTAGRLPALMLTVRRNRDYWCCKPLPFGGQRATFDRTGLVWQHYTGQGWQIQWLATFGKANALWIYEEKDAELRALLDEVVRLATPRAGGIAWEYLFTFGRGKPPWVSGMAQATGIQALSRGAIRLDESSYFDAARAALGIFHAPPPTGVRVDVAPGRSHYLLYSYDRRQRVLNGFNQAVNGLHDFAVLANDPDGLNLFLRGVRQLEAELPSYVIRGWSRYQQRGRASNLGYHRLARDFLRGLCDRLREDGTRASAAQTGGATPTTEDPPTERLMIDVDPGPFCAMAERFTADLRRGPPKSPRP